jgi:hypothetical protein
MIDRRDWSEIPRVFSKAACLEGPGYAMNGHDELRGGLQTIDMFSATLHCVHNQWIEFEGEAGQDDVARGELYCVANHLLEKDGIPFKLDMGIRYEDRYVREGGAWKISKRLLNLVWQQELPLAMSAAGEPLKPA